MSWNLLSDGACTSVDLYHCCCWRQSAPNKHEPFSVSLHACGAGSHGLPDILFLQQICLTWWNIFCFMEWLRILLPSVHVGTHAASGAKLLTHRPLCGVRIFGFNFDDLRTALLITMTKKLSWAPTSIMNYYWSLTNGRRRSAQNGTFSSIPANLSALKNTVVKLHLYVEQVFLYEWSHPQD